MCFFDCRNPFWESVSNSSFIGSSPMNFVTARVHRFIDEWLAGKRVILANWRVVYFDLWNREPFVCLFKQTIYNEWKLYCIHIYIQHLYTYIYTVYIIYNMYLYIYIIIYIMLWIYYIYIYYFYIIIYILFILYISYIIYIFNYIYYYYYYYYIYIYITRKKHANIGMGKWLLVIRMSRWTLITTSSFQCANQSERLDSGYETISKLHQANVGCTWGYSWVSLWQ